MMYYILTCQLQGIPGDCRVLVIQT